MQVVVFCTGKGRIVVQVNETDGIKFLHEILTAFEFGEHGK